MCACEHDFVCSLCRDTPQDWRYELDEPEPPLIMLGEES